MDQYLEQVMIYTYITMLLRIPTHSHVFLPTKLHLVSTAQAPSWQVLTTSVQPKLKCSILCRTNLNIFTVPNIVISDTKLKSSLVYQYQITDQTHASHRTKVKFRGMEKRNAY
jgi:thiosulfate reductase cytochrome b subunit